ncbi:MAG: Fe-S cluster assembly protein SufD [Armatimonadetes bacterium]|nr:Fe-S cluster assembly protein SufD [Armatimonadota bacterium]
MESSNALRAFEAMLELSAPARASEPGWLAEARRAGLEAFRLQGIPTTGHEEWRSTPLTALAATAYEPAPAPTGPAPAAAGPLGGLGCNQIEIVNGAPILAGGRRQVEGVSSFLVSAATPQEQALVMRRLGKSYSLNSHPFAALNLALHDDALVLHVTADSAEPLHIRHCALPAGRPSASASRVLVVAEPNARAAIVETFEGPDAGAYLTNAVIEFWLGDGAAVEHCRIQAEGCDATHLSLSHATVGRDSRFTSTNISLGSAVARYDGNASMLGSGGECTLNGVYIASGTQLIDNHTYIDHAVAHCQSHELYKGVLAERSRGVFNGKILVREDAQKTDAKQTNQVLLLSDDAQIHTKPQLEIFADDVRCTHGATIGRLDSDALFYLRARGIPADQAHTMLVAAFAGDVVERIADETLRGTVDTLVRDALRTGLT